jgi:hypothetical protein
VPSGGRGDLAWHAGRRGVPRGAGVPLGIGRRDFDLSCDHRAAAAEGASRGENRPFRPLRAHERTADADLDVSQGECEEGTTARHRVWL